MKYEEELLTDREKQLLDKLADVANEFFVVSSSSPTRYNDIGEAVSCIHTLQRMILANAAARAYPDKYRLFGGVVEDDG